MISDSYPFGMVMPGRSNSSSAYRFGFNGKENDNEVKGTANEQDYGMRIYDPRLGKFLSVDPLTKQYPELTPFQFASNSPIKFIDIDGLEAGEPGYHSFKSGLTNHSEQASKLENQAMKNKGTPLMEDIGNFYVEAVNDIMYVFGNLGYYAVEGPYNAATYEKLTPYVPQFSFTDLIIFPDIQETDENKKKMFKSTVNTLVGLFDVHVSQYPVVDKAASYTKDITTAKALDIALPTKPKEKKETNQSSNPPLIPAQTNNSNSKVPVPFTDEIPGLKN